MLGLTVITSFTVPDLVARLLPLLFGSQSRLLVNRGSILTTDESLEAFSRARPAHLTVGMVVGIMAGFVSAWKDLSAQSYMVLITWVKNTLYNFK